MRAIAFLLNRYRDERSSMLLLAVLVLVTAFLAAAAPRLFNGVADDGVRHVVGRAVPAERNLELGQIGSLVGGPGLDPIARLSSQLEAELPDSVRRLIVDRSYLADSSTWSIAEVATGQPSFLRFRAQSGLEGRIEYIEGIPPTGATQTIPGRQGTIPGEPEDATVFEIALSEANAEALAVGVGDRLELIPDVGDPLVGRFSSPVRAAADVVGIYRALDPDDEYWQGDTALDVPTVIVIDINTRLFYVTGLISPDAYAPLMDKGFPARYAWRYAIDPDRLDAGVVTGLIEDLRLMETRYPPFVTTLLDEGVTTMQTRLLDLVEEFAAERRTAEAVLVTAALGPLAVAAASVALVALLVVHRRRRSIALVRGRGASVVQLAGTHLLEGLLLALPAAALAYLAAVALVNARGTTLSPIAAAGVALAATLVLVLTALRPSTAPLRQLERETPTPLRASPRRLAFEVLVIVLAAGGAFLLRQRGLAGGSAAGELAGVDPLLAAVPALIGLAVGLVTIRLYPLPVRVAGWFADGWRGMVPALGLRRAARTGDAGSLPLIVLLVTVAIGAFSSTMFVTIERGQDAAAWQETGAQLAIRPGTLPFSPDFDATALPGVESAAAMHTDTVNLGGVGGARVEMNAVELQNYPEVVAGTPAASDLPSDFGLEPDARRPIPAIISRSVATEGPRPIRVGDEIQLVIGTRQATIRIVQIRSAFPGIDPGSDWLLVPQEGLRFWMPARAFTPDVILASAPGTAPADLRAALAGAHPSATLETQADVLFDLRASPLVRGIGIGFVIAVLVAIGYAALATTVALVLMATVRSRETAHLRTLGMSRGAIVWLAVVEHGPAVIVAIVIGLALGIGVAWFVAPGLGLAALIGSSIEVVLEVDWSVVALLLAALIGIVAVGIVASTWIGRRAALAESVRQGIE